MELEIRKNKFYIDGEETTNAKLIGEALKRDVNHGKTAWSDFTKDQKEVIELIDRKVEMENMHAWLTENWFKSVRPCVSRIDLPFSPNFIQTQILADLVLFAKDTIK